MTSLRIGFLLPRHGQGSTSYMGVVMRMLSERGVVVDRVYPTDGAIEVSSVRVEHDLYVLKKTSGLSRSLAGALHAQGAAMVNSYPVTVALGDRPITFRILRSAGVPTPDTYVARPADQLAPLLDDGPLIVKSTSGFNSFGVHIVRSVPDLANVQAGKEPVFAQRYLPHEGQDLKIYSIGGHLFGVRKPYPTKTEEDRHGHPFVPTPEQCKIALRCGEAFGIDLYGVDIVESDGRPYVVDVNSMPGFKGVPDAPRRLAEYFFAAAERAACGEPPTLAGPPLVAGA